MDTKGMTKQYFIDTRDAREEYTGERKLHFEGQTCDGSRWTGERMRQIADRDGFPLSIRIYNGTEEVGRIFPSQESADRDYAGPYRDNDNTGPIDDSGE